MPLMREFQDPIFKGCTRPAMILGVPIIPFTIAFMVVMLISFWTTILLAVLLIPIIIVMREITKTDDQQFRLLWIKILCRYNLWNLNRNKGFWKATAYSPIGFQKRR